VPFLSGCNESDWERGAPGDWPTPQQSRWEFSPTVPKARARHVAISPHAKFAEVRLSSFVSAQSLQLRKAHQHQNPVQTETRRRPS
jgi:hypothetical protein